MAYQSTRSTRFLTGLSTLLLVASIGFGIFLLAGAVVGFGPGGGEVAVHSQIEAGRVADLPDGAVPPDDVDVTVRVDDASRAQLRWAAARDLAPSAVVIAALWLLRGLLGSVRDGDPFAGANVRRLRALALVVLIGVPLAGFISSIFANELAASAGLDGGETLVTMPGGLFLGGIGAFVLAEVFAAGVRLRDDLEGTV